MQVKLENEIAKKNIKNNRDAVDKLVDQRHPGSRSITDTYLVKFDMNAVRRCLKPSSSTA